MYTCARLLCIYSIGRQKAVHIWYCVCVCFCVLCAYRQQLSLTLNIVFLRIVWSNGVIIAHWYALRLNSILLRNNVTKLWHNIDRSLRILNLICAQFLSTKIKMFGSDENLNGVGVKLYSIDSTREEEVKTEKCAFLFQVSHFHGNLGYVFQRIFSQTLFDSWKNNRIFECL